LRRVGEDRQLLFDIELRHAFDICSQAPNVEARPPAILPPLAAPHALRQDGRHARHDRPMGRTAGG
ncbi:hypothetical protein, partial [Sphingomonas sp.]|uniref:hypothetical protein n=1 Tax=Sphingomonas sp. TaxID=28214 RepID=UPI0035C879A8